MILWLIIRRRMSIFFFSFFFFFNDTATTEIYPLSLHDALPILFLAHKQSELGPERFNLISKMGFVKKVSIEMGKPIFFHEAHFRDEVEALRAERSEEHTSELQSLRHLVCRLLLEKKKSKNKIKK